MFRMIRSTICILVILLLAGCAGTPTVFKGESRFVEQGIVLMKQGDFENARAIFAEAAEQKPEDPDAQSWLGESLRRLGRSGEAFPHAEGALALDPCHSFAHTLLGDLYNPQYAGETKDEEKSWQHYLQAVQCAPLDGNAWISIWLGAMKRGDSALEWESILQLHQARFWPKALVNYNRWVLSDLPDHALLLTNGDVDTYPAIQLQILEDLRPDVAVINLSLLNLPWYRKEMANRHDLPLPEAIADPYRDETGQVVMASNIVLREWLSLQLSDEFPRPISVALTVDLVKHPELEGPRKILMGGYYQIFTEHYDPPVAIEQCSRSLLSIRPEDFRGEYASRWDRSPGRNSGGRFLANNPVAVAFQCAQYCVELERFDEATEILLWLREYGKKARPPMEFLPELEEFFRKLEQAESGK